MKRNEEYKVPYWPEIEKAIKASVEKYRTTSPKKEMPYDGSVFGSAAHDDIYSAVLCELKSTIDMCIERNWDITKCFGQLMDDIERGAIRGVVAAMVHTYSKLFWPLVYNRDHEVEKMI